MTEPGRPGGKRPLTLRPLVAHQLVTELAAGGHFTVACALAGIARTTAQRWRDAGRSRLGKRRRPRPELLGWFLLPPGTPDAPLPPPPPGEPREWLLAFAVACDRVEALAENSLRTTWVNYLQSHPDKIPEYLARRFPDRWSQRSTVSAEVSGPGGAPIQTQALVAVVRVVKLSELDAPLVGLPAGDEDDGPPAD